MINKDTIKSIAEESGMMEFEHEIYETNLDDLQQFAKRVVDLYESDEYDGSLE